MAITDSDYYGTLADADAYFENQLHATDWTSADDDTKRKGLLAAFRAIESLRFRGYKLPVYTLLYANEDATQAQIEAAAATQATEWPRDGDDFATSDGTTITGECPDEVFFAQCEEAISLISGKMPDQEFCNLRMTSDGVSSTRVSTDPSRMPPQHTSHFFTSPTAFKYLKQFFDEDNNSFEFDRN